MAIKETQEFDEKIESFIKSADMKKGGKGGRPKKIEADKLTEQLFINCTKKEKESIKEKALKMRMSVSNYVKYKLDEAGVFQPFFLDTKYYFFMLM